MKKIILFLFLSIVLSSCFNSQKDIDSAKQNLIGDTPTPVVETPKEIVKEIPEDSLVQIIPQDDKWFLKFNSISERSITSGEVIISGTTELSLDSIQVLYSNPTSKFPDDDYTLQAFKTGDETFKYIASSKNQVLDFGENDYIFRAKLWNEISETKIIIEVPDKEDTKEETGTESQLIGTEDNTILIDLPTSSKYGEPMKLGEASFTYTQIKWLEINKEILESVTCETLTEYLTERMNSWYYWNTCREIVKEEWIKFNVIRLNGEDYIYERHYIDFSHGLYGVYELETGTGVDSENIADKNTELKSRDFPSLDVVDDLMKDIVNS